MVNKSCRPARDCPGTSANRVRGASYIFWEVSGIDRGSFNRFPSRIITPAFFARWKPFDSVS
jgi:hypothetical protein